MEFAAAFHIVTLPPDSRLLASNLLLETNPTSLVLPFFAGMCGVESHDVLDMVGKVAKEHSMYKQVSAGRLDWPKNQHEMEELLSKDYRSLWTLFNCICEAKYAPKGFWRYLYEDRLVFHFSKLRLDPMDCAALGCCMKKAIQEKYPGSDLTQDRPRIVVTPDTIVVTFAYCRVHEVGLPLLVEYLYSIRPEVGLNLLKEKNFEALKEIPLFLNVPLGLKFMRCGIGYEGIQSISKLVTNCGFIHGLDLGGNWRNSEADRSPSVALKYLIKALSRNQTVKRLDLSHNGMRKEHTWHLVLLLTCCKCLHVVSFSWNRIGPGMRILARAFQLNTNLVQISLMGCCIKDKELNALGLSLASRKHLELLGLQCNLYSNAQFIEFILLLQRVAIGTIYHSQEFSSEEMQIINDINMSRVNSGMASFSFHFVPNMLHLIPDVYSENVTAIVCPREYMDKGKSTAKGTFYQVELPY